jgi:hypothetical protein
VSALPGTPEHAAERHLEAWAAELAGDRRALSLRGAASLDGLDGHDALTWLDAPAKALPVERLRDAAVAGVRLVLAVSGLERGTAAALAERLGALVAGEQLHVQGTVICGPDGAPGGVPAAVGTGDEPPRRILLTANVEPEELERAASVRLALALEDVHAAQLERLEAAYWSLRRANARLARENLGRHDAAAASVVGPLTTELEEIRRQLAIEVEVARQNDEYFQAARAKLDEPHHRAAERLYQVIAKLPGGGAITRKALSRGR